MAVFVLDKHGHPLMPCTEKRARLLLARGRARVHRVLPFCIRLVDRIQQDSEFQPLQIKLDPGSKLTGLALVRPVEQIDLVSGEVTTAVQVLNLFELQHRGRQISEALTGRRAMRRRRRSNLRYRAPRFLNRGNKQKGWLAPSLQHRVDTTLAWVKRLQRWAPITAIAQELVRFDMQKMEASDIEGVEYQRGTLFGFELWEYLLAKWGRTCAYCDVENVPFEKDHIHAKSNGGTNRVSNFVVSCRKCNEKKDSLDIRVFLKKDPARLARVLAQAKRPLKDAAAVNSTRWALFNALKTTGLQVTTGSGGLTKFNRSQLAIPKTHALDAVCVGVVAEVQDWKKPTLNIKCTGRGSYKRTHTDKYGFPRAYLPRAKSFAGFQTGDMVKAVILKGKYAGMPTGRVSIRQRPCFGLNGFDVHPKYLTLIQRADGYGYQFIKTEQFPSPKPAAIAGDPLSIRLLEIGRRDMDAELALQVQSDQ